MRVVVEPTPEGVATAVAARLAELLEEAVARRGIAHLALTGGSSAAPAYERLATRVASWDAVHLWWSDERCVAPDDEASNFLIARRALIEPLGLPADRVHRMRGELGPAAGALAYAAELTEQVEAGPSGLPALDVVDLGLGPDGHVASLFPDHPALDVVDALAVGVDDAPKPPPARITLTLPALRAARRCVVHTSGAGKRVAASRMDGEPGPHTPASLLDRDRLLLIVDDDAAGPHLRARR